MIIAACLVSGLMAAAAGANSDFCLPGGRSDSSPDDSIMTIVREAGYTPDSYEFRVVSFYVEQCQQEDPFDSIISLSDDLVRCL